MVKAVQLPSPAKVNRFLHIIGRRQDGYHLLQTFFQFISLEDTLTFETREDNNIVILPENHLGISTQSNIIYKAARLLQQMLPAHEQGITIHLDKKIPLGAGLGGGSSNAATTLIALNHLWQCGLSLPELLNLGAQLGADVPIFILGESAFAEGIGEIFTPRAFDEPWITLLSPPCHVETRKMYALPELTRNTSPFKIGNLTDAELSLVVSEGKNDFEPAVRRHFKEVDEAMNWLSNFGKAKLSGSGASVFSCFNDNSLANNVIEQCPSLYKGQVVRALNTSPLKNACDENNIYWGVAKR